MMKTIPIHWRRLSVSLATCNESPCLELSWAWEPMYREGAWRFSPSKRSLCRVIAETWADKARLKVLKNTLLFDEMFVVSRINRGGGLVLFWKNSIKVSVKTSSRNHIDSIIGEGSVGAWRFTGFYGEPVTHMRHESWELLQSLNRSFNLPWLVAGDFNEIISNSEKKGGIIEAMLRCKDSGRHWMPAASWI